MEKEINSLVPAIKALLDETDKFRDLFDKQDQQPLVLELKRQIVDLQNQAEEREKFIAILQQQTVTQLIALLSESHVLTGPAYRRLQPKLDDLQRMVAKPEDYIKPRKLRQGVK